ncbi:NUDIX hydrolase [Kitasatospora sp. NPDC088346]|uniref:NUDIX hydrolase n=1 Tax=Kitasatospora sp. NPDC088346 TaxID=3364073 RepID=UPI003828D0E8
MGDRLTAARDAARTYGSRTGSGGGGAGARRGRVGRSTILAAGAVLWVPGPVAKDGRRRKKPRIALVHRPKYDDWSLPKGKLEPGEGWRAAVLREVREETGLDCVLGDELPAQHYRVNGRPKEVRYWAAVPTGGGFAPNREVDRLEWLAPRKARARLTHPRDRELVDALLAALGTDVRRV